ncbi:TFCP2 [Lepeophtheirus salmonis]|uniref:TFCP2 n=1 Tax=Lepeophtheirus salmonis TaxID=72036 RepID=A0A7R8CSC9_LEPSM|nr:TFCP2 [Lepeophtheirus salmonis]CAF2863163.1 TFCP2 [Lepeophtheirus salmonis]
MKESFPMSLYKAMILRRNSSSLPGLCLSVFPPKKKKTQMIPSSTTPSKGDPPCTVQVPNFFHTQEFFLAKECAIFLNPSSPLLGHDEDVESLILEAAPLVHHISTDTNNDEELPLCSREFTYILDAPTAFWNFNRFPESSLRHGSTVTSIILMDFREQKSREEALKTWAFWHSRQHSDEIRILDVECNVVSGIVGPPLKLLSMQFLFQWSPDLGNAYIMIAVSMPLYRLPYTKKGIKGIPLQLQIDTSDDLELSSAEPCCQVKYLLHPVLLPQFPDEFPTTAVTASSEPLSPKRICIRYRENAFLMKVLAFEEKNTQSTVHDIVLVDLKTSLPDIRGGESHHSMSEKDTNNNNISADNNNNESL